jgi:ribonuclease T1
MMRRCQRFLRLLMIGALLVPSLAGARSEAPPALPEIAVAALPAEAQRTIELIKRGGPFPYQRDGVAFGNYERLLPARPRGYYREFTVPTPGAANRGARRIIAGAATEYYYTADHYRSFRRVRE